MITFRILAVTALLFSSFASARVTFSTFVDVSKYRSTRVSNMTFEVDVYKEIEIYNDNQIKVMAELTNEQEDTARIRFTLYTKKDTGRREIMLYEITSMHEIELVYDHLMKISLRSSDEEKCSITVKAYSAFNFFD